MLAVEDSIHVGETQVLEAEDALNVVVSDEDAVHASHAGLQGVFQHGRPRHVVELALKRLPLAQIVTKLVASALFVFLVVHADRDDGARLQVKDTRSR